MDEEELRIMKLARVGREKIIKYGTYDMQSAKHIYIQDHPFYVMPEPEPTSNVEDSYAYDGDPMDAIGMPMVPPPPPISDEDLTAQILSSNFKTGLSQAEVDALLSGMNF